MNKSRLDNFLATHPIYKEMSCSVSCRAAFVTLLFGLGLPIPATHKKETWGYERVSDTLFMPIKRELDVFYRACEMADSKEFYIDNIIEWISKAALTKPISRRNFFYLRERRPLFPEYKNLSIEDRIQIVENDRRHTSPVASDQTPIEARNRQAEHEIGTAEVTPTNREDGEEEGS